ncbi:unnamed protein product, partial [Staurois parvus]
TSPVSSSIIFLVTSRILCVFCLVEIRDGGGGMVMGFWILEDLVVIQ